jgi:hypothetical protein
MREIFRLVMPIVIAVALGPLIAGLVVSIFAVITNILENAGSLAIVDLLDLFGFYIVFAYILGSMIALLAGTLMSVWMIWRPPSAIVAIAAAEIATCVYMGIGALGFLGPTEWTNARSNFLFTFVLATSAAAGCWFLTRRFVRAL